MRLHNMFKKTGEKITSIHSRNRRKPEAPEGILKKCNKCGAAILTDEVINGKYICPKCHGYFRIPAYKRIELVTDAGSFEDYPCSRACNRGEASCCSFYLFRRRTYAGGNHFPDADGKDFSSTETPQ